MFHKCCVLGCGSRRKVVKLFQFPKSEIGLDYWLKCVSGYKQKCISELRKLYVCEKHFEKRFITAKSRLRYGAYPTLFTAEEIANGFPHTPDNDIENCNQNIVSCKTKHKDHNYCKDSVPLTEKDDRSASSVKHEPLEHAFQEIVALAVSGSSSPTQDPLAASHLDTVLPTLSGHSSPSASPTHDTFEASHQEIDLPTISGHSSPSFFPTQNTLGSSQQDIVLPTLSSQNTRPASFVTPQHSFQDIVALAVSGSCSPTQDTLVASHEDTVLPTLSAEYTNLSCSPTHDTVGASHQYILLQTLPGQDTSLSCPVAQDTLGGSLQEINVSTNSDNIMSTPKEKNRRKRLVYRTASLSPDCKKLYIEYKKLNRRLEFYKKTRKFVNPYTTEASFKKMTEGLTHGARTLMWMQLKQLKKKNKGRRFTREEKLYCLSIMKRSPECYKLLQSIFTLPSRTTLKKLILELNIEAGTYPHIFPTGNEVDIQDENREGCP